TRVVSTKEQSTKEKSAKEKEREKDVCVRISFADKFFKNMTRKSVEAKIDRAFAGVFKRVPKVQYELFSSTDKFIVNGDRGPEKSRKTYFYVNCRAIDALLKEAEELKISQGIRNLEI
uniref:Uncharacterized protein n=1 Tax=Panagrolaimus sp. ES5 TaxID=591445 RepID=A0AC34GJA0_9BILA